MTTGKAKGGRFADDGRTKLNRKLVSRPDPVKQIKAAINRADTTPEELADLAGRPIEWATRVLKARRKAEAARIAARPTPPPFLGRLPRPIEPIRPDPPPGGRGPVGRNG